MTLAAAFFLLLGLVIGAGIAYGVGFHDGHREGYRQGCADRLDRELDQMRATAGRLRAVMEHRNHVAPPFDIERVWAEADHSSTGEHGRWHGA